LAGWHRKLAYCIAFSADGCMDVTRRYVRDFTKWGAERARAPEPVLLYILDEIRAMKRKNLAKQEKFKLEGEEMREYRELQLIVAQSIAADICKIIPDDFYNGRSSRPVRSDPDAQKAAEARAEAAQAEAERQRVQNARRAPGPHNPDQQPPR
jgi:peptide-N4-(N-acetyl-beta-glucosaminyl)asparagine amidase